MARYYADYLIARENELLENKDQVDRRFSETLRAIFHPDFFTDILDADYLIASLLDESYINQSHRDFFSSILVNYNNSWDDDPFSWAQDSNLWSPGITSNYGIWVTKIKKYWVTSVGANSAVNISRKIFDIPFVMDPALVLPDSWAESGVIDWSNNTLTVSDKSEGEVVIFPYILEWDERFYRRFLAADFFLEGRYWIQMIRAGELESQLYNLGALLVLARDVRHLISKESLEKFLKLFTGMAFNNIMNFSVEIPDSDFNQINIYYSGSLTDSEKDLIDSELGGILPYNILYNLEQGGA